MTALVKYEAARRALAEAKSVDEVKDIRDKAVAMEAYFQQAKNTEAERRACEIRLRAERKAGQLLAKTEMPRGGRPSKNRSPGGTSLRPLLWKCLGCDHVWPIQREDCHHCHNHGRPPKSEWFLEHPEDGGKTLRELGISKKQSSRWQALAGVPEEEFEAALAGEEKPSTNGIIAKPPQMPATSLWLWGRLRDFERDGLLKMNTPDATELMTNAMLADVRRLAPLVAAWLKELSNDIG